MRIHIGTVVEWVSGAWGVEKLKRGVVIAHLPAGSNAWRHLPPDTPRTRLRGDAFSMKDRYLVEVRDAPNRAPRYYTPLASVIERQNAHLCR